MGVEEATGDALSARAGVSALVMFGSPFGYRALRQLVVRGIPGGPGGMPEEELPDEEEFDDFDDDGDDFEGEGNDFEGSVDESAEDEGLADFDEEALYQPTPKVADMLRVVLSLRRWLEHRPGATLDPGRDPDAGPAMVALIEGWSSTVIHALAGAPRSLEELRREASAIDGETVAEVLAGLQRYGLAVARPGDESRHELTGYGRESIAPLIAAALHERLHPIAYALPPDVLDVEATFAMALPLLRLPEHVSGRCRLGVWLPNAEQTLAGATVEVEAGRVASSSPSLDESPDNFVTGLSLHWCEAAVDPTLRVKLKSGGDEELIDALLTTLHERLFGDVSA